MRTIVVYESMYGNTRSVAEAVGRGLAATGSVRILPVSEAAKLRIADYALVVVGGPTHVHGMSRESSRRAAEQAAAASGGDLVMETDTTSEGLREWLGSFSGATGRAASFDTRAEGMPSILTGRASKGIARLLRRAGFDLAREPESFLVDAETHLVAGEEQRAQEWGASLAPKG